ncbi:uncharacterized protein LOC143361351 [Halictus rubicundus]|uniref:uncharacterized protein LOC143361351 n=1 Tax=Halictus rubicundus TaxID=77578 RepID=UPI004035A268
MSASGFRGRGFGPRGARTNGPSNGFSGPRFPHPTFNHVRPPPHRLSGSEKWTDGPNFAPWQQNKNFIPRPQFRGNLQFRPNGRGRAVNGRGIVRFSGPGRPPGPKFCMGFMRNPAPRVPQEEEIVVEEEKSVPVRQTPLLGSEEERQQKITETADKLKQKLSSITEEDLTNFWEDDLSVLPNSHSEDGITLKKGIPELRHEPPELDLTFTDFRDIGRVGCNNSKFDNMDDRGNGDDVIIAFESGDANKITTENDDITTVNENQGDPLNISELVHSNDNLNQSSILLEDDGCQEQMFPDLSSTDCNLESSHLQCDNVSEDLQASNTNTDVNLILDENIKSVTSIQPINDQMNENPLVFNDIKTIPEAILNDQDALPTDFLENQSTMQDVVEDTVATPDTCVDTNEDDHSKTNAKQQDNVQANVSHEEACQTSANTSDSTQTNSANTSDSTQTNSANTSDSTQTNSANTSDSTPTNSANTSDSTPTNSANTSDSTQTNSANTSDSTQTNSANTSDSTQTNSANTSDSTQTNSANTSDSTQTNSATPSPSNEETPVNSVCDSKSPTCSPYEEVQKLCNPPAFQPRLFNIPPRFAPRIPPGPRCRWAFQPNGKNVFFRGPQRLPFHGNRMPPPRHIAPYKPPDMGPVTFGPCAPPPFTHNVPASSHDSQHHTLVPFSSSDLPPAFDPSEPPPNIRPISVTELSNRQEITQSRSPLDPRNQVTSVPPTNVDIMQPPPSFDPRGPPPRIGLIKTNEKLPEFNPQQPPPKIHKQDKLLRPPLIFDPRLSSQERSKLIAPRNPAGPRIIANFSQPPPFMPNLPVNYQPVLPQTNNGQVMVQDFGLPPPPMNIADVPPPPPQQTSSEKDSGNQQGTSMDDGLEDMQEAMEFAKQIMNMSEKMKSSEGTSSELSEAQCTQSEIPVPREDVPCTSSANQSFVNSGKKQKKKESKAKKVKQATACETEQAQKSEEPQMLGEEQGVQSKSTEDTLLTSDQIRPKVIFNLSSKTKVLQKQEEWHRPSANISETREVPQSLPTQISQRERRPSKKYTSEQKRNNQTKTHQKEQSPKVNWIRCADIAKTPIPEKSNDAYNKDHNRDSEKSNAHPLAVTIPNDISAQKSQKSKKENRKSEAPTSESSWKNRVISRFLKMSKNDICNMVNNSSLRKFDIAMKHLVKERRSSLSLKMRNTEDEKMKEYDREEFMNQLNAMLDPGAVVGITDLPTEFIHHLSEVLQLDPMPTELESSEQQKTNVDEVKTANQNDNPRICSSEYFDEESIEVQTFDCQEHEDPYLEQTGDKSSYTKDEPLHCSLNTELAANLSREDTSSSKKSLLNKSNPEAETLYKRQQPLFNEADLDDILSQVTERTRSLPNVASRTYAEVQKAPFHPVTETFERNTFAQISNATAADLDDIFSAGIARAKSLSKSSELNTSRARKSSSEDRNTFRSERYERWSRKEREDPDSFRNLTKEEWEAKYGTQRSDAASDSMWKDTFSSAENLSRGSKSYQRYCSSDSPMRNLSMSPLTHELTACNQERYEDRCSEMEEPRTLERSESSNDRSTSSSSDTDDETVAHNVTKLLKVIKEKEKIAKKRSLNETIRDEVTAEIEKKWKEKSKYKERKSRKREKRKKDKREKRKKEKKRKRKRNSHSNTSRSSEYSEEYRLLTEEEIKKEVTVKEEPLSSFEDSVSQGFNNECNESHVEPAASSKTVEASSWVESQPSQPEKQQVPTIACDKVSLQPKKKPTIISMTVQPKTKAQLKQMPFSDESEQNQNVEKPVETESAVSNGSTTITDREKTNENVEEATASEVTQAKNECTLTPLCTNDPAPQTNAPLNIVEQSSTEAVRTVNTAKVSGKCTHPVTEVHTANQPAEQKATSTGSNENRSGYKKIDIKVYKERALQRRLQEEAKLKEKCGSPVPASQESPQPALPTNKPESETETEKEMKLIEAGNNVPLKDPRLAKARSSHSVSPSSQKEFREKANVEEEHQYIDIFQKNKEPFASAQSRNESPETKVKIKSITRLDSELNILKDPLQPKNRTNDDKPSSQERAKRESDNLKMKVGSKGESDEKKSKKLTTAEHNKFKNIRSEGSKELKLKKEKKLTEKKSAKSKSSTREKDSKHPQKAEELQKSTNVDTNNAIQAEVEKINSSDTSESLQSRDSAMSVENFTQESSSTFEINKEQVSTDFAMEEGNNNLMDDNKDVVDATNPTDPINKELMVQQVLAEQVDQEGKEVENSQSSLISQTEQTSDKSLEANTIQCESNEELAKEKVIEEVAAIAKNVSSADHRHDQESQSLDENKCLNNENDLKSDDNNTTSQENKSDVASSENLEIEADGNQDKSNSIIQAVEDVQMLKGCNKAEAGEIRSPDSSGSPFKGFFVESIEDDIPQESVLCNIQIEIGVEKESITKDCTEWTEVGMKDQPNLNEEKRNPDGHFEIVEETKDSDEVTLTRSSIEEQSGTAKVNIVSETVSDNFNVVDSVKDDAKNLKSEDEVTLKGPETDVTDTQHSNFSPSRDTFDEDGEPFIILDEYIDETEGRSLEKLNHFDIDLEECIARDMDMFLSAPKQGEQNLNLTQSFNSIDFKELSEDLDKINETSAEAQKKIKIKPNITSLETNEKDSAVADVSSASSESNTVESNVSQKDTPPDADDAPRLSPIQELSCAEAEKTEHNSESSTSSKESAKLSVPVRTISATASGGDVEPSESRAESNGSDKNNKKQTGGKTVSISSDAAEVFVNWDVQFNTTVEQEKQQELRETLPTRDTSKPNKEEENEALHKVKDKPKMKSKQLKKRKVSKNQIKEAVAADTVKPVHPSTKEAIMARMIEIDVEIHKLMTEKMTLYQMLTSDALPTDSDFEQNDAVHDHKDTETTLVRPRTPSALMSQLIQNIETKPVANQCAKTTVESVLLKDSTMSSVQLSKSKISRCEQRSERKAGNVSTCSSENEEAVHRTGDTKSPPSKRRRKQKGSERAVKWDNKPECIKDTPHVDAEDKQTNNADPILKPILKKVGSRHDTSEDADHVSSEVKPQEDRDDASAVANPKVPSHNEKLCTPGVEESEKATEQTESRDAADESDKTKATEQTDNKLPVNVTDVPSSMPKVQENRTPERSSIYSDDSTWDSLLQAASDDQRKPTTGLALLEETYKKEMAKTRRIKAETRKKKKKKETRVSSQVPLTPEEEELPLSTLYTKKLHARKKLNPIDQEEEKGCDDQQVWKNVVEVINAVAENRLEDLYTGSPVEQLGKNSQINVPDADDASTNKEQASGPKPNPEPKLLAEETKEIVVSVPLTSIEDTCTEHSRTPSDDKVDACNYEQLTSPLNKTLPNSEEQADEHLTETETFREITPETPTSIEKDVEPVQQTAAENLEISQVTSSSAACSVESGANDVHESQAILNTSDVNTENAEETNAEKKGEEIVPREEAVDRTTYVNPEETIAIPDASNRNEDETTTASDGIVAHDTNKNSSCEPEHANEESSKDSSLHQEARCEKECVVDDPEGSSDPKDDHFISLKDHKALKKRRESERSNKSSSEENNNRNRTPVPVFVDAAEVFKSDEAPSKKPKRKRGSSRTPLRRSSRYTEEVAKRIKLEIDGIQPAEQESLEKNVQMRFPSVSPASSSYDDDTESISSNGKKSRNQKTNVNRKRNAQSEVEVLSSSSPTNEDFKDMKRCKHTMPEMMNCKVRLVDSKHTILKPNVDLNVLRKYGISTINLLVQSPPVHLDQPCSIPESTPKDSRRPASTVTTELPQGPKLIKKVDDATRSFNHSVSSDGASRGPGSMKTNLFANDKEATATSLTDDLNLEVAAKDQVVVDISQENRDKPDIEIVEEKTIVTKNQHQNDSGPTLTVIDTKDDKEIPRTQYTVHKGPILDIKVFESSFLAASEDGRIYRYSQASNGILNIYKGHKAAVTCLYVYNPNSTDVNKEWMFSGSLDGTLRCYNITTGVQLRDTADIGSPIQCMDEAWGIIFIGTKSGHVSRYHIKSGVIKGSSIQFSDKSVLALKATNEGPRRVLIVASRSQPITIRDAQNGLFLRTICGQKSHTVYSLMRDHNLIYCGTSTTSILVFDFTNGEQITQYDAGVGIVCMRLYKQLLFAGCYDGNIYIFDTKDHRLVCSIPGPGNMLLSMEVIDNKIMNVFQIIAGSKDKRLQSWQMSRQVRALL